MVNAEAEHEKRNNIRAEATCVHFAMPKCVGKRERQIVIDVPVDPNSRPAIGNKTDHPSGSQTPGSPWAICITPPPDQVLYSSDAFPGRIYKLSLDGKVLGMFGKSGKQLGQFGWIHEMACPSENELYVAELLNWRVQKLLLNEH